LRASSAGSMEYRSTSGVRSDRHHRCVKAWRLRDRQADEMNLRRSSGNHKVAGCKLPSITREAPGGGGPWRP
jgi:hypothetical protein